MGFYKNTSGVLTPIAGGVSNSNAPIGAIYPYGGSSAPSGYLMCDGSAVSRTDYSALFAVIGTSFGAGDGSTTFNVPDLRESVPVGASQSTRSDIATHDVYTIGQFKDDQLQEHRHSLPNDINAAFGENTSAFGGGGGSPFTSTGTISSGRTGTTTHGKQLGVNYIIKAKDVNLSVGGQTLADRVETLADRVETLETTISGRISGATTSSGTLTNAHYVRSGNVIQLRLTLTDASLTTHSATTLVVTMPSTVPVPVMTVDGVANVWNGSVDEVGHVRMDSGSRNVVIYSSNDNGVDSDITDADVWATVTYITAD